MGWSVWDWRWPVNMSRNGVWKEYKLTIILGPCQCSAFALNCSRSLFFFFFWFQIKEKGRKAWHDRLNWHLKPTLIMRFKKKQMSAVQANLGRRTNTEKEKNVKLFSAKRMSYRLVDVFASVCVVFNRPTVLPRRHLRFAVHFSCNIQTDE